MVIDSVSNKKVQMLRRLAERKHRKDAGLYIVEGWNIIKDIPPKTPIHSIFVMQSKADNFADIIEKFDCPSYVLSDRIFEAVADTVAPNGIIAVLYLPDCESVETLDDRIIALDGISDSGNLGTIIRTAVAFGYRDIILISCADAYSNKTVRSSMGGVLKARLFELSYEEFASLNSREVYILDMSGENIGSAALNKKFALVVGSEAQGVSQFFRNIASKTLSIPMSGDMESLNAAISAAIAMYEIGKNN
ncbi:MAG: RNA methyltransferase [Clostridia bacterium]|nr:RNA methyltransferase [Clostridia bacterium]